MPLSVLTERLARTVGPTADWLILKSTQLDEALQVRVVGSEIDFRISDASLGKWTRTAAHRKWVNPTK